MAGQQQTDGRTGSSSAPVALAKERNAPTNTDGVVIGVDIGGSKTLILAMDLATGRELTR